MAKLIVTDDLWTLVEPLIPKHRPSPKGGHPPVDDRLCLTGILFVLKTNIAWEDFPQELGCCGMTPWNRPQRLAQGRGVEEAPRTAAGPPAPGRPDRLVAGDGRLGFGPRRARGEKTGPSPVDRRKKGSKHHVLTDGRGTPLAATLTAANRNDVTQLLPLLDAVPPVRGKVGRPRRRPAALYADRAYDSDPHRARLRRRGIRPHLARRRTRARQRPGGGALWGRTDPGVAPSVQAPADPLRHPRRYPRIVSYPGLLRHLLAAIGAGVLLAALSSTFALMQLASPRESGT